MLCQTGMKPRSSIGTSSRSLKTLVYELSGQTGVVFWTWLPNRQSPWTIWEPLLPMEDYQRQMRQLCTFVEEKTGLPLLDLARLEDASL